MKKLFYTLVILLSVSISANAQETTEIAASKGTSALSDSKTSGSYVFTLPGNVTKDDVDKASKYYTHYFTVGFDEGSHEVSVNMVDNTAKNRYVIARFLTACGVRYVTVDKDNIPLHDFIEKYLQ